MRSLVAALAVTVGSFAFQLGLQAGWFNRWLWAAPWAWGLSVGLWFMWIISHPRVEKEWLKDFHVKVGWGIHLVRAVICLIVVIAVSLTITALLRRASLPAQANTQQSPQSPPAAQPESDGKTTTYQANEQATPQPSNAPKKRNSAPARKATAQQSAQAQGERSPAGNIDQSGNNGGTNNAVVGNNNEVGNTYNVTVPTIDRDIQIVFKDSPLFTAPTKQIITKNLTEFRDYLAGLDIPVPKELPPLGTRDTADPSDITTSQFFTPLGEATYRGDFVITSSMIAQPAQLTKIYCTYVMEMLFERITPLRIVQSAQGSGAGQNGSVTLKLAQPTGAPQISPQIGTPQVLLSIGNAAQIILVYEGLASYLNSSFWNIAPVRSGPLSGALWEIRTKYGRDFTDGLVTYTLRSAIDSPLADDSDYGQYFIEKLEIGARVKDNDNGGKWQDIRTILQKHGFPLQSGRDGGGN